MPKLPPQQAKAVDDTESSDFSPIPPGKHPLKLNEVKVGEGEKGPYWSWEFEVPAGYEYAGRRFWHNTSLSEASRFKMKETFEAFGVTPDTDTDDCVGCWVTGQIGVRTIQKGDRAGEQANTIVKLLPFNADDFKTTEGDPGYDEEPF